MNPILLAWLVIILLVVLTIFLIATPLLMSRYRYSPSSIAGSSLCSAALLLSKPAQRVNIQDSMAVKHVLDEYAANFVVETGYEEDIRLSNAKLILGGVAVLIAFAAQFYPLPFPESRDFLLYAVILYFSLNFFLQLFSFLTDRDAILLTKPRRTLKDEHRKTQKRPKKKTAQAAEKAANNNTQTGSDTLDSVLTTYGLCLRSQMNHLETNYRLILSFREGFKSAIQVKALSAKDIQEMRKTKQEAVKKDIIVEQKNIATENTVEYLAQDDPSKLETKVEKFIVHSSSALPAAAAAITVAASTPAPSPLASSTSSNSDSTVVPSPELSAPFESILLSLSPLTFTSVPVSPSSSSISSLYVDRIFDICDFFDEKGLLLVDRYTAQLYCLYKEFQEKIAQQLHEKSQ